MIIGATKKAQPLFSVVPTVEDVEHEKRFVKANPLFSWHANYININRKKVLIFLNDQTYTPIILQDVNAKTKKKLPELFQEAMRIAFELAEISSEKTEEYLKLAGNMQVTTTSNRSIIGSINLMADELSSTKLDLSQTININEMVFYSNYIHTKLYKQGYNSSAAALQDALKKPLKLEEVVEKEPYIVKKNWNYSEFSQLDTLNSAEQQWEKYREALVGNNEKLLTAFKKHLIVVKGLSEKTVKRHIEHLYFYLNIYLAEYERVTPIDSGDSAGAFLGDFFVRKDLSSSLTSLKQNGSALKKFYQFLYEANEISENELNDINEYIRAGLEEGVEYLDFTMEDEASWF
ncbi:site-specific integrase [Desemzia sp. C1]|uniref:DUF6933 domain-containing protein n=1 Tax=Desemzia sp. C1 TaxID=2892016 RepID=UPI001E4AFFCD|nr:site-specific integrase [Desemzia sp. C1]MCI3027954.1 site-specific integrase [Desemzia sp. C1]